MARCYVTPAFSGIPKKEEQDQNWLSHPCLLEGPKEGENAISPLHSRGSPTKRNKRIGCLTPAFSGAQKRAEVLCHHCILGEPEQRGTKSEVAASPLPSRGPKRGQNCYVTPAFSGNPNKGEQNQKWVRHPCLLGGPQRQARGAKSEVSPTKGNKIRSGCLTPPFLGAQKRAEMLCHPCILRGSQRQARGAKSEVSPTKGNKNENCLSHPCLLGGPKRGRK